MELDALEALTAGDKSLPVLDTYGLDLSIAAMRLAETLSVQNRVKESKEAGCENPLRRQLVRVGRAL